MVLLFGSTSFLRADGLTIGFETGDFSEYTFVNDATYPWVVTSDDANTGTYCMKSTNSGVASSSSTIEATFTFTQDGTFSFAALCMGEGTSTAWDKCIFSIDGVQQFAYGAHVSGWNNYTYDVAAGTHTMTWSYTKDSSVNPTGDYFMVDDITVSEGTVPPGPTPPGPTPGEEVTYDFDDNTMQGWTAIDANNDGYNWVLGSEAGGVYLVEGGSLAGSGHNSSADLMCSGSYSNVTNQAITPDNYLVSPAKDAYIGISFFACGQDASYVAEHFGVAVSTGSASASDFTMLQEWTMTAKSSGVNSIGRGGQTRAQGSWHEYTVDLSAYEGQEIWVAIRHFNCNDQFILDVDDITLSLGGTRLGLEYLQLLHLRQQRIGVALVAVQLEVGLSCRLAYNQHHHCLVVVCYLAVGQFYFLSLFILTDADYTDSVYYVLPWLQQCSQFGVVLAYKQYLVVVQQAE